MSVKIEILDYKYTDSTNTVIDWENSIVGELDITDHSDFPLAMTFQISDFKDITSTSGDYSKTFKIPATKNNNNLLKHLYIPNINVDNRATERKSCRILANNLYSQVGLIKVNGIGGYGETPSHYSCVFYGNNLGWASDIEDRYMNTLDWGVEGDDLEYNKPAIMATWQDDDCTSSASHIVYPITSYGQYNAEGDERTIQLLDTATDAKGWNPAKLGYFGYDNNGLSYGTPLPVPDWRPAVFVKNTLDKIYNSVGYKISSAFMSTANFKKNVWLLPNFKYNNPDEMYDNYSVESNFENGVTMTAPDWGFNPIPSENGIQDLNLTSVAEDDGNYYYTGGGRVVLDIQATNLTVNLDNGSYVDLANNWVEIGEYGKYTIDLSGVESKLARGFSNTSSPYHLEQLKTTINVEVQTVGQSSWVVIALSVNTINPLQTFVKNNTDTDTPYADNESLDTTNSHYFNKGDKVRLTIGVKVSESNSMYSPFHISIFFKSKDTSAFNIRIDPNNVEYGQTYNLTDVMNPDYKQIDFIKGIAHAYNLQMTTDESTKTIYIEPFDNFYKPYGDAVDWTAKVNRANEITDKWIENDLKRTLVFKYKSDGADAKVKIRGERFFKDVEDEYPYREILPDTFERGDSTFENPFFAGTYNAKDQSTVGSASKLDTAYSACLWEDNVSANDLGRPNKGFEFLPRLLHWNKYSPASINNNKRAAVQTWSSVTDYVIARSGLPITGNILDKIYPQATMINRDSLTSPLLSYGNAYVRDYNDATGVYGTYQVGSGLYDTYYRNMVEMLKRSPRLRTISIDLKVSDVINLDFTKLVYIDGVYWRINKVVDYMPNQNSSTKVELIEWFQVGVFAASAPSYGSSGGSSNWGVGGSYTASTSSEAEPPSQF